MNTQPRRKANRTIRGRAQRVYEEARSRMSESDAVRHLEGWIHRLDEQYTAWEKREIERR